NAVAKLSFGVGPMQVTHLGQLPSVTFSFDLRPGIALSQAIGEVQAGMRELAVPATLTGTFSGTAQAFQSSLQGLGVLILLPWRRSWAACRSPSASAPAAARACRSAWRWWAGSCFRRC